MSRRRRLGLRITCRRCHTDWQIPNPDDMCQMICQPDEHTYLWWECPDCGWQPLQLTQRSVEHCERIGVPWFDWSDIEPDPHPEPSIVEWAHMIQVGEMNAERAGIIMLAAAERCIDEARQ